MGTHKWIETEQAYTERPRPFLWPAQLAVVRLLAQGKTLREAAIERGTRERTVRNQVAMARERTGMTLYQLVAVVAEIDAVDRYRKRTPDRTPT